MMEGAMRFRPDIEEGRWCIEAQFKGRPWEVIVEPMPEKKLLVVVTAYDVNRHEAGPPEGDVPG
jgi:hypothetical protein